MNRRISIVMVVITVLLAGCSSHELPPKTFGQLVRKNTGNMRVYDSRDGQLRQARLAVDGTFARLERGESTTEHIDNVTMTDQQAVAWVRVRRVLWGDPSFVRDGFIYLKVNMGPLDSFDAYAESFPAGRRVVVLLAPSPIHRETSSVHVDNPRAGLPDQAVLLSPIPQGYFFEDKDGSFQAPYGRGPERGDRRGDVNSLDQAAAKYAQR